MPVRARLPRLSFAAALLLVLSLAALAPGNPAEGAETAPGAGYLGVTLKTRASGKIVVTWDSPAPTKRVRAWRVHTSTARTMKSDARAFAVKAKKRRAVVPAAALVTPASGDYTFVKLEIVRKDGSHGFSPTKWVKAPVVATDAAKTDPTVVVGTFNVRSANLESGPDDPFSWGNRRGAVVDTIRRSGAEVVALQEASGGNTADVYGFKLQYQDLADRLGSAWQLANPLAFRSDLCVTRQHRGDVCGKQGTRIIYDASKLLLLDEGSFALEGITVGKSTAWTEWVRLRGPASGRELFVVDAHLQTGKESRALYDVRQHQIEDIIAFVRSKAGPQVKVVLAGDLNSTSATTPDNGVHRALVRAGFFDSFSTADVEGDALPTTNNFTFPVKPSPTRRDYIVTYGGPSTGSYWYRNLSYRSPEGTPASDHFMQVAKLPY